MSPISTPIPQDYSQWRSTMERHIHAAPEDHQFFWLIDPCAHEDLPGIIRKLDPQADPWPLYMDTYLDEAKNSGPFMVPYRTDSEFTGWMLRELTCSGRWLCSGTSTWGAMVSTISLR